jgi:hypothetical protein
VDIHDSFAGPVLGPCSPDCYGILVNWIDVDCSNLVDLLAVSLWNQHLGGSLFGDKMLRDVEWWAWCIKSWLALALLEIGDCEE